MSDDGADNVVQLALAAKKKLPPLTEDYAALEYARLHRGQLLYDHDYGAWFRWSGKHWQQERTRLAYDWARSLVRKLTELQAMSKRRTSFVNGVEKFATVDRAFATHAADWNTNPFLLATPGGTVDLRTGHIHGANPDDRINQITAVAPAIEADCPLWHKFLAEATNNDQDLIAFLRRWCGYCLTGDIREHALVFIYGDGGTGKGTFMNTVSGILGDYAKVAAMETFVATTYASHPTDLAMLCGARLVTAAETDEGHFWAETRIKQITGGDPITARFMRQDFFTYQPAFKLTIIGNHEPALRNVDDAARRRFNIVPFNHKPEAVDRGLKEKLKTEWPGILRWMLDGALDWQDDGLSPPASVQSATSSYFENQDLFGQWLEEKCDFEPSNEFKTATSADLYTSWAAYAKAAGEPTGSRKLFSRILERRGGKTYRQTGGVRAWQGVRLKPSTSWGQHGGDPSDAW
jgi:putative DNA primase/helicase